jgi:hypothetical protein
LTISAGFYSFALRIKVQFSKIAKIAKKITLSGCRIRVREQSGETIILIGAAAAQRYPDPTLRE